MTLFYGVHKETYWRKVLRKFQFPKKYLWSPVIFNYKPQPSSFLFNVSKHNFVLRNALDKELLPDLQQSIRNLKKSVAEVGNTKTPLPTDIKVRNVVVNIFFFSVCSK